MSDKKRKKDRTLFFLPDRMKAHFYEYTPAYLQAMGKRALLCDIDNTLVTYDDPEPTDAVRQWLDAMKEAGITVGFISNNSAERVGLFNRSLGLFASPDAHKPLTTGMKRFLRESGLPRKAVAHLGDQIFTDVLMAHAAGITALLVPPIKDKLTVSFRFKRALEKPLLWLFRKLHKNESE